MRLDQFVSQSTGIPRSEVPKFIRGGQVLVNGARITKTSTHIDPTAEVLLHGERIVLPGNIYLMLHKPAGVVSATEDAEHRTVLELIEHPHRHTLHVVGRLDKDTTGLLLLTNDGDWSHRISAPKHHVPKTYLATLAWELTEAGAQALRAGVQLNGEKGLTKPAEVEILPEQQARITISEGKYHQVKRMFAAIGNRVEALHRERVGQWVLDPQLGAGEWKLLNLD
ncbi:MAG: pseudouridine synthase [Gammaproteobacteria bacterium]|nr:pseudouridine synthase [Gammaproteobacteria bacterium]MBU1722313.1 pseudouridine synthase [Gammaproteobacteria bacterium]MBU2006430.1 pseudouridine synthase [Gammaproteobacteria bacterium]